MSNATYTYTSENPFRYTVPQHQPQSPTDKTPKLSQHENQSRYHIDSLGLEIDPHMTSVPYSDRLSREGSVDSNDQDQELFITPANSARPSIISPMVHDGDMKMGLGLGVGFPMESEYHLGSKIQGEEVDGRSPRKSHTTFTKPPILRSRSEESVFTSKRSLKGQSAAKDSRHENHTSLEAGGPSGYSSALSPRLANAGFLQDTINGRNRLVSPNTLKSFAQQQDAYLPEQTSIATYPRTHQGEMDREVETTPTTSPIDTVKVHLSEPPRSRSYRTSPNNTFNRLPTNLPTGTDSITAARIWQAGDQSRARGVSSSTEKGYPLSSKLQTKEKFTDSQAYWLGLYFFFNLGLTLFNKFVLVSFPFPYTLTGLHALSGCVGCYIALERGAFTPARLTQKENIILCLFSVLYTINIAVSNISLQLVTVPFHQVVRASTPFFTILTSVIFLRTRVTMAKMVALLPVVAGVGFATYGDYYFTAWGLVLTLLGTFLAALKTVATNLIQTGGGGRLKLHPLDLLMRMSPLAFVQCVIYGWYTGELERVRTYGATEMTRAKAIALLINGVIACGLNIVSFTANKKSGPLTMTVSANCKQVITIALAVILFDLHISITNAIGILLTLVGGCWYGVVEYREKTRRTAKALRA